MTAFPLAPFQQMRWAGGWSPSLSLGCCSCSRGFKLSVLLFQHVFDGTGLDAPGEQTDQSQVLTLIFNQQDQSSELQGVDLYVLKALFTQWKFYTASRQEMMRASEQPNGLKKSVEAICLNRVVKLTANSTNTVALNKESSVFQMIVSQLTLWASQYPTPHEQ